MRRGETHPQSPAPSLPRCDVVKTPSPTLPPLRRERGEFDPCPSPVPTWRGVTPAGPAGTLHVPAVRSWIAHEQGQKRWHDAWR